MTDESPPPVEPAPDAPDAPDAQDAPETTGSGRSIGRNIGALAASQATTWILATLTAFVVPRYLGADAFGALRVGTSVWMIAGVLATVGTSTFLTVEIARRRPTFRSLMRNTLRLRFTFHLVIAPIVVAFLLLGPYDRVTREVGLILGIAALFNLATSAYESGMYGLQEMGHTSRIRVITKFVVTAATITVVVSGLGVVSVAFVTVLGSAVTLAMFVRAARSVSTSLDRQSELAGKALLVASLPFFAAEATRVLYQEIDTVVMSLLVDETAIGIYAVADSLFGSLLFVPVIVTTALFPVIAEMHERRPDEVGPTLGRTFDTLLLVSVPIGLGTIVVAPSLIELPFGSEFEKSADVLAVYGVVVILASQTILLGRFALATGRVRFWTGWLIGATVLTIPLDIVLVPWADDRFDNAALGGALAYVVTEGMLFVVGIATVGRGAIGRTSLVRAVKLTVAGGAMLAAGWPFRDLLFVIPGALSVVAYVVVVLALRTLAPHERDQIRGLWARLRRDT